MAVKASAALTVTGDMHPSGGTAQPRHRQAREMLRLINVGVKTRRKMENEEFVAKGPWLEHSCVPALPNSPVGPAGF